MKRRVVIALASIAALACMAALFHLTTQISRARLMLEENGALAFDFVRRHDHDLDEFTHELRRWQQARRTDPDAPRTFITRFDAIRSTLGAGGTTWTDVLGERPATRALRDDTRAFLVHAEPLMSPTAPLDERGIDTLAEAARALGRQIHAIDEDLFARESRLRDDVSARLDDLLRACWFFGGALLLAGLTLSALLARTWRRSSALFEQSNATRLQLATALEELDSGDIQRRKQNRFIATASHDLRQPLHALGLYLTTLRGHVGTPLGRRVLDNASRSTEALNQLLSSVLDISRLDAEVIDVHLADVPLDRVFENLQRTFLPNAGERCLTFDVSFPGLVVHTDRVLLDRILGNLVSNAIHYTERGGVTLSAERDGEAISITVSDTGRGIPERERESVFEEYYQIDLPTGDTPRGLGLGLSIVHRLARLLGIGLDVQSTPGTGTRFTLHLTEGDAVVGATQPDGRFPEHRSARADGVHFDGLVVLVIDDDRDVRDGMHRLLEQCSCRVMAVESAHEACVAIVAEEVIPDVIVADYRLRGGLTGVQAIATVREEVNEDVPALIVTADTSPARLREARASGYRLLHKPVVPEELFDAIGELAGRNE